MTLSRETSLLWRLLRPGLRAWWAREGLAIGLISLILLGLGLWLGHFQSTRMLSSYAPVHGAMPARKMDLVSPMLAMLPLLLNALAALSWFMLLGRLDKALRRVTDDHAAPVASFRPLAQFLVICRAGLPVLGLVVCVSILSRGLWGGLDSWLHDFPHQASSALRGLTGSVLELLVFGIVFCLGSQMRWVPAVYGARFGLPMLLGLVSSFLTLNRAGLRGISIYSYNQGEDGIGLLASLLLLAGAVAAVYCRSRWFGSMMLGVLTLSLLVAGFWFAVPVPSDSWSQPDMPLQSSIGKLALLEDALTWLPLSFGEAGSVPASADAGAVTIVRLFAPLRTSEFPGGWGWFFIVPLLNLLYAAAVLALLLLVASLARRKSEAKAAPFTAP